MSPRGKRERDGEDMVVVLDVDQDVDIDGDVEVGVDAHAIFANCPAAARPFVKD